MDELDLLNEQPEINLDGLTDPVETAPVVNKASNKNLAAHLSFISGSEDPVGVYRQVMGEYDENGESLLAKSMMESIRDENVKTSREALSDVLIDPTIDDETKAFIANDFLNAQSERYNIRNTVSEKALAEEIDENKEQEMVRLDTGKWIDEINYYKKADQQLLTAEVNKTNYDTVTAYMDIVQYLSPFMESTMIAKLTKDYREGLENGEDVSGIAADAILLTGSAKAEITEGLKALPPAERHAVKQKLAQMISNSSSIVMSDDNDFARTEMLRTFVNEDYSETEKWIDNATSILDFTLLGGSLVKLLRGARKSAPVESVGRTDSPALGNMDEVNTDAPGEPTMGSQQGLKRPVRPIKGKNIPKSLAQKYKEEGFDSRLDTRRQIKTGVQPVTVAQNVKDMNPVRAAKLHAAVVADKSGEMAEALYGTSRTEAIAYDLAPEIGRSDGVIDNKVGKMDKESEAIFGMSPDLQSFVSSKGATWASDAEKKAGRAIAWSDFQNAKGLTLRNEMSTIQDTDAGAKFSAVFGPENGGYRSAQDAVELSAYALRKYGVTAKDITLLKRTPEGYKDVKLNKLDTTDGDYLVKVDYDWEMKPLDVTAPEQWTVKRNLFDRFAGSMGLHKSIGTVTRNLLDAASVLDPRMVKSAFTTIDRSSRLEQLLLERGEDFAKLFDSLPAARRDVVYDYFKEANHKGLAMDKTDLIARGFQPEEIEAVEKWRKAWDEMYWLENDDAAKTMTNRGYMVLVDKSGKNSLLARPIARNQIGSISVGENIYDPVTDTMVTVVAADLKKYYDNGGVVANLRTPITQGGTTARYVMSPEKAGTVYLRGISKYDQVLPYRQGYYKVSYTAPHFIVNRVKDGKGNVLYEQALSVAGTKADAIIEARRLAATKGGVFDQKDAKSDFYIRGDAKGDERSDLEFEVAHAGGRSSQRFRGQRLSDSNAPNQAGSDHSYIMSPAESLVHSARNISRRAPMREWLDAMKDRYVKTYADFIPEDQYKRKVYPTALNQITKKGRMTDKDVADARTTWAYIEEMESGYINSIDDSYKAVLNKIADKLGNVNLPKGERTVRTLAESRGPMEFSKNVAFHAYLVGHPLRQALIQAHQAMVYLPMNPQYVSRQMVPDIAGATASLMMGADVKLAAKMAGRDVADMKQFLADIERSGLVASIDKQNLVRSSLSALADDMHKWAPTRALHTVGTVARRAGFDLGETMNMVGVFGVFRDKALKEGKTLTPAVLDDIAAKARNYSLGMNRAGDMPYNQNALGMLFQFMQVPHKMSTLMTTNRILSRKERAQLAAYVIPMWTLPAGAMYTLLDKAGALPENEEARNLVVQGAEAYMINKAIQYSTGSDTQLDLSSLGPFDAYGLYEFVHNLMSSDMGEILANTPSGQLFFGNNPRITDAFRTMVQWTTGSNEIGDPKTFNDVLKASASIFSGMDAGFKAAYILEHGKKIGYSGAVTNGLDDVAAIGQLFGFTTIEETERAYLKQKTFKNKEALKKNVTEYYNLMKRSLADESISHQDRKFVQTVLRTGMTTLKKEYGIEASTMLYDMMERDIKNNDSTLYKRIVETSGFRTAEQIRQDAEMIKDWNPESKARYFEQLDGIDRLEDGK